MPKYVATVMLTLKEIEVDSEDDAVQYASEEYMNLIQSAKVYVREVE